MSTDRKPWEPSVLVLQHHHGTHYMSAITQEDAKLSALHILRTYTEPKWAYPTAEDMKDPEPPSYPRESAVEVGDAETRDFMTRKWTTYDGKLRYAQAARKDRETIDDILATSDGVRAWRFLLNHGERWFERVHLEELERPWLREPTGT